MFKGRFLLLDVIQILAATVERPIPNLALISFTFSNSFIARKSAKMQNFCIRIFESLGKRFRGRSRLDKNCAKVLINTGVPGGS